MPGRRSCGTAAATLPLFGRHRPREREESLGNTLSTIGTNQHGMRERGQQHKSREAGKPYADTAYSVLSPGDRITVVPYPSTIVAQYPRQQQEERRDQSMQLVPEYKALAAAVTRTLGTVPLSHMEYRDKEHGWMLVQDCMKPSPLLEVILEPHAASYSGLNLPPPHFLQGPSSCPVKASGLTDTGAQMDICSPTLGQQLGLDTSSLFLVKARVFASSRGASIDIIGGIIVKLSAPGREQTTLLTVRLMYVASNMSHTYFSLSTLTARLGVVGETFPRIGESSSAPAPPARCHTPPSPRCPARQPKTTCLS